MIQYDEHHNRQKVMRSISRAASKAALAHKQPESGGLVRELRQLMQLTQEQLATELGVAYETVNRWENERMQPSLLALKQIRSVLVQLSQSSSKPLQDGSAVLLSKYFAEKESL